MKPIMKIFSFFILLKNKFLACLNDTKMQKMVISIFFIVIFISFLYGVDPHENIGLDYSWIWAINNLINSPTLIPGADYTFTYGPLGFILIPLNYGHNLFITILCSIICSFTVAGLLFFNYKNKEIASKNLMFFAFLFFIFTIPTADWLWIICVYLLALTISKLKSNYILLNTFSIIAGILSGFCLLLKMNLALCALSIFAFLAFILFFENRKKFYNYLSFYMTTFLIVLFFEIKFLFLNLKNFTTWIQTSLEIARGFSYAMAFEGSLFYLISAIIILILYTYIAILAFKKDKEIFKLVLLGIPLCFFVYKHGFVRQDTHMFSFYSTIFYVVGFIYLFSKKELSKKILNVFVSITILSLLFLYTYKEARSANPISIAIYNISCLINFKQDTDTNLRQRENIYSSLVLPKDWRNEIKDSPIEILPGELVYIQANNGLNWRPNPILQLYSVYTQKLDMISADSFNSIKRPDFILLGFEAIDDRNMFLDTPATFNSIFSSYESIRFDNKKILLKRHQYKNLNLKFKNVQKYKFNELIYLPDSNNLYAKIYIEPSFLGKVITFIFRSSSVTIDVNYETSGSRTYKVIPDTLQSPISISHIPNNIDDLISIIENKPNPGIKVKSIDFINHGICYKNVIKIEWFEKY